MSSTISIFLLARFARQILDTTADILFKFRLAPPPPLSQNPWSAPRIFGMLVH